MNVQITVEIKECVATKAEFEAKFKLISMAPDAASTQVDLSKITMTPDCGTLPDIANVSLDVTGVP